MGFYLKRMRERAKSILKDGEKVMFVFRQSLLSDVAPTFIVVTDQRLIIINNSFWGLYAGINFITPTYYNYIPYNKVAGIVLVRGKLFATLNIRLLGRFESNMDFKKKTEGEIDGLMPKTAIALEQFVEQQIKKLEEQKSEKGDKPYLYETGSFKR